MKRIQIVPVSRLEEMRKMLNTYLTELSEFDPDVKFDKQGVPIYKWFDCYWQEKNRFPIYFMINEEVAGFTLVREVKHRLYEIAEFYVIPKYRKDGNAIWFATSVTDLFEGELTFSTRFTNPRAIRFWDKFSKQFEENSYKDDAVWRNWTIRKII